jgi:hypothetical protein
MHKHQIALPNLFIVGAAKAGTTFLFSLLGQHPEIFTTDNSRHKEPAFFSNLRGIRTWERYVKIFSSASGERYIAESSTAYLTDPASAQRIYNFNQRAKIIILLRNPVHRAYSLYNWMVQSGYEYSSSFELALEREEKRSKKKIPNFFEPEYFYNYMYFSSGLYSEQIQRYIDLFNEEDVYIELFENFIANRPKVLTNIFEWLDLEPIECNFAAPKNPSIQVRSSHLGFALRKISRPLDAFKNLPKEKRDILLEFNCRNKKVQPMNKEIYGFLHSQYSNERDKLSDQLRLDLSSWQ